MKKYILLFLFFGSKCFSQPNLEWAKSPVPEQNFVSEPSYSYWYHGTLIQTDDSGNIYYLIGTSAGGKLIKLNSSGDLLWTKQWTRIFPKSVSIGTNFIHLTGGFQGTVSFDNSISSLSSFGGNMQAYYHRLDLNGNHQMVLAISGTQGSSISTDQSDISYISDKYYTYKISSNGSIAWTSGGSSNIKVSRNGLYLYKVQDYGGTASYFKVDIVTGKNIWYFDAYTGCGGANEYYVGSIEVDYSGSLIISGTVGFGSCATFANSNGFYYNLFTVSSFVVKINSIGNPDSPTVSWISANISGKLSLSQSGFIYLTTGGNATPPPFGSLYRIDSSNGNVTSTYTLPNYYFLTGIVDPISESPIIIGEFQGTADFNPLPNITCNKTFNSRVVVLQKLTNNPATTVSVNATDVSFCRNSPVTLTASGASTYTWTPSLGLAATTGSSVAIDPLTFPFYDPITYTITGTDANGCTSTATVNVSAVNGSGYPTEIQLHDTARIELCKYNFGTAFINNSDGYIHLKAFGINPQIDWFSNSVNSNSGGQKLNWNYQASGIDYVEDTWSIKPKPDMQPGVNYVYAVVSGGCGIVKTKPVPVIVHPETVITHQLSSASQFACAGVQLTPLTVTAAGENLSYTWSKMNPYGYSTGEISDLGEESNTFQPNTLNTWEQGYYNLKVTVTGLCAEATSISGPITVQGEFFIEDIQGPTVITSQMENTEIEYVVPVSGFFQGGYSIQWSVPTGWFSNSYLDIRGSYSSYNNWLWPTQFEHSFYLPSSPESGVVQATVSDGVCFTKSASLNVEFNNGGGGGRKGAGTNSVEEESSEISVFPNPANDQISITIPHNVKSDLTIVIYSPNGANVLNNRIPEDTKSVSLNTSALASGLYTLHIIDAKGNSMVKKIFVIH